MTFYADVCRMRSIDHSEQLVAALGISVPPEQQSAAPGLVDDGVARVAGALEPPKYGVPEGVYGVEALQRRVHVARVAQVVQPHRHALHREEDVRGRCMHPG